MPKLKELMTSEELSEYEAFRIEEERKKKIAKKNKAIMKSNQRKMRIAIEEKIPPSRLEFLLKVFKQYLSKRIDSSRMKTGGQSTRGLKQEEKDELKRLVQNMPSKNLNNSYKRTAFARKIIKYMVLATMIREHWEFGDPSGYHEMKTLDDRFPSLIGISWKTYIEWVNTIRESEGRLPIKEIKKLK
jgi:hypothetical protein